MNDFFRRMAQKASTLFGSAWAFTVAMATILAWAATGPIFHFSDTWQLVINTWTNLVTFVMVFVIQNSQNRDSKAMLLKLDELIRSQAGARNALLNLEGLSEADLARLESEFKRLRERFGHTGAVPTLRADGSDD
jgi:low affinity Fe/Cu permease